MNSPAASYGEAIVPVEFLNPSPGTHTPNRRSSEGDLEAGCSTALRNSSDYVIATR